MSAAQIKANINLHAILKNLKELIVYDKEMKGVYSDY